MRNKETIEIEPVNLFDPKLRISKLIRFAITLGKEPKKIKINHKD